MNWKKSYLKYVGSFGVVSLAGITFATLTSTHNEALQPKTTKGHLTLGDLKHESLSSLVSQLTPQQRKQIAYEELINGVNTMPPDKAALFKRYIIDTVVEGAIAQQDPAAAKALLQKLQQERKSATVNPPGKYQYYHQWSGVVQAPNAQDLLANSRRFKYTNGYSCLLGGSVEYQLIAGSSGTLNPASPLGQSDPVAAVFLNDYAFESTPPPPGGMGKVISYPLAEGNALTVVGATGENIELTWSGGGIVYFNLSTEQFSSTPISSTLSCANISATPLVSGPNGFTPSS